MPAFSVDRLGAELNRPRPLARYCRQALDGALDDPLSCRHIVAPGRASPECPGRRKWVPELAGRPSAASAFPCPPCAVRRVAQANCSCSIVGNAVVSAPRMAPAPRDRRLWRDYHQQAPAASPAKRAMLSSARSRDRRGSRNNLSAATHITGEAWHSSSSSGPASRLPHNGHQAASARPWFVSR